MFKIYLYQVDIHKSIYISNSKNSKKKIAPERCKYIFAIPLTVTYG